MNENEFNQVVGEAIEELPSFVRDRMEEEGVAVHVCDEPSESDFPDLSERERQELLGAFFGRSIAEQHEVYLDEPNRIELYQSTFTRLFRDRRQIKDEIELTLIHELGHFLGMSEKRVHELEKQIMGDDYHNETWGRD